MHFVEKLDFEERQACVKKTDVDYFTDAIDDTNIKIQGVFDKKNLDRSPISCGEAHLATQFVFQEVLVAAETGGGYFS